MKVLEINEIRLFGLMAERLFLDPIGYLTRGGSEKPPHDQAPVF